MDVSGQSQERTVLLVEDEMDTADAIAMQLRDFGFGARLAHSAAAALHLLEGGVKVDAVVSDILLAEGMNGLQFARALGVAWPKLPVLMVTGFDFAQEIAQLRGVRTIAKPFRGEQIAALLDEIITSGRSAA